MWNYCKVMHKIYIMRKTVNKVSNKKDNENNVKILWK